MCANCQSALQQRSEAAAKLLEACSGGFGIGRALRLAYPPSDVPDDMRELALKLGGTKQ